MIRNFEGLQNKIVIKWNFENLQLYCFKLLFSKLTNNVIKALKITNVINVIGY